MVNFGNFMTTGFVARIIVIYLAMDKSFNMMAVLNVRHLPY
jgi:hypothetical protein